MIAKAYQRANMIFRTFILRGINALIRAFIVYVRPILEYNSVVWSPQYVGDIERVEQVQRKFTKRLYLGSCHYTYTDRLRALDLQSLELRRLHIDLMMVST